MPAEGTAVDGKGKELSILRKSHVVAMGRDPEAGQDEKRGEHFSAHARAHARATRAIAWPPTYLRSFLPTNGFLTKGP